MKKFLFLSVFLLNSSLFAGTLFEPYIGYAFNGRLEATNKPSENEKFSGYNFGLRFGGEYSGVIGGIIYDRGSYKSEVMLNPSDKSKYTPESYGIFLGWQSPTIIGFWASYFISSKFTNSDDTTENFSGHGYEAGLGLKMNSFVSLNIQYRKTIFTEASYNGLTADLSLTGYENLNAHSFIASLSFPIIF